MNEAKLVRGQRLNLRPESWGRLGEAMARYNGQDIFVLGAIPGELVIAEVLRARRKYVAAQAVEILEPSPQRVDAPCRHYGQCTGCQWQHLDYRAQLKVKEEKVVDALRRVGGIEHALVLPAIPSPQTYGYRNHARFTVGRAGDLGFVNRETRQFIPIDYCMLMHQGINDLLESLQGRCGETTQLAIRSGEETRDFLIQPALKNPAITAPSGQKRYTDSVRGHQFRVASPSFFQVNVQQTSRLLQVIQEGLYLTGNETLLDAYTGVGTFAVMLAPLVKRVYAVEESSAAVANARENAAGLDNVEFLLGKAEEVLASLPVMPDAAILDPPRAGCQPAVLESLLALAPPRVVYVSCDPETLARDLKVLGAGYTIDFIQPLDMFPQTHHVECAAVLSCKQLKPALVLASSSPRRRELLTELGLPFRAIPSNAPEEQLPGESPTEMVRRLSLEKARLVAAGLSEGYVVGADSTVVFGREAVGKPANAEDARQMLRKLRGTAHQVTTGLTVIDLKSGRAITDSLTSDVQLRNFSDAELEVSIASGTPMDKAGAYAVQDQEFRPARLTAGCYSNVVGLPLCRLAEMLGQLGCPLPAFWPDSVGKKCLVHCCFRANPGEQP